MCVSKGTIAVIVTMMMEGGYDLLVSQHDKNNMQQQHRDLGLPFNPSLAPSLPPPGLLLLGKD